MLPGFCMASFGIGLSDVSRETTERLHDFANAVAHWTRSINLVADSTVENIWARHILDAVQIMAFAPLDASLWCDLGSGAGFPGIVVAIVNKERNPACGHVLIESDTRKAAFLTLQAKVLGLNCRVVSERIESSTPAGAEVVTARALAPLPKLLAYASRHGATGATYIFPKGQGAQAEVIAAREGFDFDLVQYASETDRQGAILVIRNLTSRKARP